jgi:hypothetical protein
VATRYDKRRYVYLGTATAQPSPSGSEHDRPDKSRRQASGASAFHAAYRFR